MKFILQILFVWFACAPAWAKDVPTWGRNFEKSVAVYGSLMIPPDVYGKPADNSKLELYIRPQLTFYKLSKRTNLVGYSIIGVFKDIKGLSYNNKITVSLGVELQYKLNDALRLSFGVKYKTEQEFATGVRNTGPVLTADLSLYKQWYPDWKSNPRLQGSKLVLSGWANYRYPGSLDPSEKTNGLLQGAFKFAVSIPLKKSKLRVAPFVSIKAKADHKGRAYNNYVEPALGVDLQIPIKNGGSIAVGTKAAYQWRYSSGATKSGILSYVSWYKKF